MSWVRATLFYGWMLIATLVLGLVSFGIRAIAPHHALWLARIWALWLVAGVRTLCGIHYRLAGAEHLPGSDSTRDGPMLRQPDAPMLLAVQHQSAYDTLVWMNLLPRPSYIFKSELARIPIVGPMLLASGQIPVERRSGGKSLPKLLLRAEQAVADRRQIIIFPQGTRTAPGVEVKLHVGIAALAKRTRLDVVPVATDSGHLWRRRAFRKRSGLVRLVVGPPLSCDLPTDEMLARIAAFWQSNEAAPAHVDNSVGESAAHTPDPFK